MIQRLSDNSNILTTTGAIISYSSNAVPAGWLICDGSALNALVNPQYQRLYDAIGNTYGGSNNTNFQLPDLRGQFLRGLDHSPLQGSKGIDNGRTLGSIQAPQMSEHTHTNQGIAIQSSNLAHDHPLSIPTPTTPSNSVPTSNHNHATSTTQFIGANSPAILNWTGGSDYYRGPGSGQKSFLNASTASNRTFSTTANNAPHSHDITSSTESTTHNHTNLNIQLSSTGGAYNPTGWSPSTSNTNEIRPQNIAIYFLIKV